MITFGYVKQYRYTGDGTLMIQVRVPSIHGPFKRNDANGQIVRNYVEDNDLPYYPSMLLPHLPLDGEVAVISSLDKGNSQFVVLGLTGGSYYKGAVKI